MEIGTKGTPVTMILGSGQAWRTCGLGSGMQERLIMVCKWTGSGVLLMEVGDLWTGRAVPLMAVGVACGMF